MGIMYNLTNSLSSSDDFLVDFGMLSERKSYKYKEKFIPSVTEILHRMIHSDGLVKWANNIGRFNNENYEDVLRRSADLGTYTHSNIEKYLNGGNADNHCIPFLSFLKWYNELKANHTVKVLLTEYKMIDKLFGGTMDLLLDIDGLIYLVDFKTSNNVSINYMLQLAAYDYLLENNYHIITKGWIVLQLSKEVPSYNEFLLDRTKDSDYMRFLKESFLSLLYSYYTLEESNRRFHNKFSGRDKII